ncbi:54S ribosomal protein L4 mitochondrial [Coemansia guatemalensis]|uniref:Large ribosomal subunit protein uL29m n=1 Tax=Coemansia guatemalensis TaxID=2761395 RepID=A0A9W8HRS1_9FUNG|nr:54S ribosomal protein L4 mitochondrial [Coemansia guatemalensis]
MFGAITRQLSTRRTAQGRFLARGFEEFFEKNQRIPTERDPTGRAWSASELRQKSWEDLQRLWYIVLKERNVLASQKVEARRLGIISAFFTNKGRVLKCRQTMARIKTVLNERQIAWEAAQKDAKVQARQQQSSQQQSTQE